MELCGSSIWLPEVSFPRGWTFHQELSPYMYTSKAGSLDDLIILADVP